MIVVTLKPERISRILLAVAAFFVTAHIVTQTLRWFAPGTIPRTLVAAFNLDVERNFPTFFSFGLLLSACLLLVFITYCVGRGRLPWGVLSLGFGLMSVDEAWSFHEMLVRPVSHLLGGHNLGPFYFAWVVPALLLVAGLGLAFLRFLRQLPRTTRTTFLWAAVLYVGGALGVELVEGWFAETHGSENFLFSLMAAMEEGLEMAGAIVFIRGLLTHLNDHFLPVQWSPPSRE